MLRLFCAWALFERASAACLDDETCEISEAVGATGLLQSKQHVGRVDKDVGTNVRASKSTDGQEAEVEVQHEGTTYTYKLRARSVYATGAQVFRYTSEGLKAEEPPPTRTFVSRETGKWATAQLADDGTVSGLFQHRNNAFLEVRSKEELSLLQVDGLAGSVSHQVKSISTSKLLDPAKGVQRDGDGNILVTDDDEFDTGGKAPDSTGTREFDPDWQGVRWFGGGACYDGDDVPHEMIVGMGTDYRCFTNFGKDYCQQAVEKSISESNLIYENQMNIELKVGDLRIVEDEGASTPGWGKGCGLQEGKSVLKKLDDMCRWADRPYTASFHVLTGCTEGNGGAAGVAYMKKLCGAAGYFNCGANVVKQSGFATWRIYAHELGHNFNGAHSFEDGMGQTGGIMDYGNGMLNGVFQFHTQYRKTAVCSFLRSKVDSCQGKFQAIAGATGPPTPQPPPSTPAPPPPVCANEPIVMTTGKYGDEASWDIVDSNGNEVCNSRENYQKLKTYTYSLNQCCLQPGNYTLKCADSYGDGWGSYNGAPGSSLTIAPGTCDESLEGNGASYRGCQTKTISGRTCQRWDAQSPHTHDRSGGQEAQNYCRNPDDWDTIWCYTTDPAKRWEKCEPLEAPGYVHHPKKCVPSHNIQKYTGKTVHECKVICEETASCVAFEYGVSYGGSGAYTAGDCNPQSSADFTGCDGTHHNLDLYVKQTGKKYCDSTGWRTKDEAFTLGFGGTAPDTTPGPDTTAAQTTPAPQTTAAQTTPAPQTTAAQTTEAPGDDDDDDDDDDDLPTGPAGPPGPPGPAGPRGIPGNPGPPR